MTRRVRYDLIICLGLLFLLAIYSFYMTLSYGVYISELSETGNYLDMWRYTYFVESKIFIIFCPIIIIYLSSKGFHSIYHSDYIRNVTGEKEYNKIFRRKILDSWLKGIYLYPLFSSIILFLCLITFRNNEFSTAYLAPFEEVHPIWLYIVSFITSVLLSIIITNFGLIISKYNKKIVLATLISYLTLLGYAVFSETILGNLFNILITGERIVNSFNIFSMVSLDGNIIVMVIYALILVFISTIFVMLVYKNKD